MTAKPSNKKFPLSRTELDTIAHALAYVIWHSHDEENSEQWDVVHALEIRGEVTEWLESWGDD